jgi:hypothetical protein
MSGFYGNDNLALVSGCQFLTVDGTSDTVTLPPGTNAVGFFATSACWVMIGDPGLTPVAAAPGAEKTVVSKTFFVPAETFVAEQQISGDTDEKPIKVAAIQATAGGTLYVYHWKV